MMGARGIGAVAALVVGLAGCAARPTYEYERPVTIVTTGDPRQAPPPAPDAEAGATPRSEGAPAATPPTPQAATQAAPLPQGTAALPTTTPVPAGPPPTAAPARPTSWRYGEKR